MTEVLVIGGGPAGAAAAIRLASAGRQVVLLERESGPHDKVCGEFLSARACAVLQELGLDLGELGARALDRVALCRAGEEAASRLPFQAMSLSRRVMDDALLGLAAEAGVEVRRGVRALALEGVRGDWRVDVEGAGEIAAAEVFVATGKHNLRGCRRGKGAQHDLVGFKLHLKLSDDGLRQLDGRVEIHLFEGGYAGLQRVERDLANLCLVIRKSQLATFDGRWDALRRSVETQSPALAARLAGAEPCRDKPLAISGIPYGYVGQGGDGLWRLGDQAAVIPSFAGEGMAIALQSGLLAAELLEKGEGPDLFQARLARRVQAQVGGATLLSQGLVRPAGQAMAFGLARRAPAALGWIAGRTRTYAATNLSLR